MMMVDTIVNIIISSSSPDLERPGGDGGVMCE